MRYRKLGNSGLKVSEISLGTWLTFGKSIDDSSATKIVHKAYESGINFFDCANIYQRGEAEKVLSNALKSYDRGSYIITTKAYFAMGDDVNQKGLSRKHLIEQIDQSLKRMNLDYVDIFYCHRFDPETPIEETLLTLDHLIKQGKILYLGVSKWTLEQIEKAIAISEKYLLEKIIVNQPKYNLLERSIETEILPWCKERGISQVVYSPLGQGVLTGKYLNNNFEKNSRIYINNEVDLSEGTIYKIRELKKIADELNVSLAQLSLAWILKEKGIASAIVGATSPIHIEENVKASEIVLEESVKKTIDSIFHR